MVLGVELISVEIDVSIVKIYGKVEKKMGYIVFKEINDNDDDDYLNDLLYIIVVWGEVVESIDEVYIDDIFNLLNDDVFYVGDKCVVFVRNFLNGMGNYLDLIFICVGWCVFDKFEGKVCFYICLEYYDDEIVIIFELNFIVDLIGIIYLNLVIVLLDYLINSIYGKGLLFFYINSVLFIYVKELCDLDIEE